MTRCTSGTCSISPAKVASKTAGVRREDFDRDENLRLALAHLLQTIGEAARRVSREYQKAHPEIPWGGIPAVEEIARLVAALEPLANG